MNKGFLLLLLPLGMLASCSTPGDAYASKHPELTPEQRKVMASGKLSTGDPVAGLTKEQVLVIMGRDPDQFTTFNGEEAFVWFRRKVLGFGSTSSSSMSSMTGDRRRSGSGPQAGEADTVATSQQKTTVFFQSGRATRVVVSDSD
jgi:hypothetical protein